MRKNFLAAMAAALLAPDEPLDRKPKQPATPPTEPEPVGGVAFAAGKAARELALAQAGRLDAPALLYVYQSRGAASRVVITGSSAPQLATCSVDERAAFLDAAARKLAPDNAVLALVMPWADHLQVMVVDARGCEPDDPPRVHCWFGTLDARAWWYGLDRWLARHNDPTVH